jgi:hypothetical protein
MGDTMTKVEVKDSVLWLNGIHGDAELIAKLESLRAGEIVQLRVDGEAGEWKKMQDYRTTGKRTPGLSPIGPAASHWRDLYRASKASGGILVNLEAIDGSKAATGSVPPANWEEADELDREAAWEAFKALRNAGWSSEGRPLTRDEWHERVRP